MKRWILMKRINFTNCSKLDKLLQDNSKAFLVYGEAATGKTSILLHIARNISLSGEKVLFISTEGSLYQARIANYIEDYSNVLFSEVSDFNEQLELTIAYLPFIENIKYIIVDSINALYRLEAYREESITLLGLILGMLRKIVDDRGGVLFASAQVRAVEDAEEVVASGMPILEYWFDVIVKLGRIEGRRVLNIVKPRNYSSGEIVFNIVDKGVEWIEC